MRQLGTYLLIPHISQKITVFHSGLTVSTIYCLLSNVKKW